ncbi:hypothetical protein ACRAVF_27040 [Bradyrhizobium oligotrophicum S58]
MFVSGIGAVEKLNGGCVRIYLYVLQAPIDGEGPQDKQIVAKLVVPASALAEAVQLMSGAAKDISASVVLGLVPEMVN